MTISSAVKASREMGQTLLIGFIIEENDNSRVARRIWSIDGLFDNPPALTRLGRVLGMDGVLDTEGVLVVF